MIDCKFCIAAKSTVIGKTDHEAIPCDLCLNAYDQHEGERWNDLREDSVLGEALLMDDEEDLVN